MNNLKNKLFGILFIIMNISLIMDGFNLKAQNNLAGATNLYFVNWSVSLCYGANYVSIPSDYDGSGTNNTVQHVFGTNLLDGTTVYAPTNHANGYNISLNRAIYTDSIKSWTVYGDSNILTTALEPGNGVYITIPTRRTGWSHQPGDFAKILYFNGYVLTGFMTNIIYGFQYASSVTSLPGYITSDLGYVPNDGDYVQIWNQTNQVFSTPQYYTSGIGWTNEPYIVPGLSFLIYSTATNLWIENYLVY